MGSRRRGRELALQVLYRLDLTGSRGVDTVWEELAPVDAGTLRFARELVDGVESQRERIDGLLREALENWSLERLALVDRNVLRLASWEMLSTPDVPARVVIDEAIEIARRFGSDASSQFVNGVLDRMARGLGMGVMEKGAR